MLLYFYSQHRSGQFAMPSSTVQMEARPPMSLFGRAVKRKSDDAVPEGTSWERELKQKVRVVDGREWCAVRSVETNSLVCIVVWWFASLTVAVLFKYFQEHGEGSTKRPCNGLDHQSSVGVSWPAPYHLNVSTMHNVCTVTWYFITSAKKVMFSSGFVHCLLVYC